MKAAATRIRWGILGTSGAAQQFALGLAYLADARLVAVGAHSQFAADAFGEGNWVPRRYGAYETLADDSDVDVVYVATSPTFRKAHVRMCLKAGKAVVCNLPLATGADETAALITLAREQGLLLMAGMWMRFLPLSARLRALLAENMIGEPQLLTADICLRPAFNAVHQVRDEQTAGQALAEAGADLAALAAMVFGAPVRVSSEAHLDSDTNGQAVTILGYAGGQLASLVATTRANAPQEATVIGDAGWVRIHPRWWSPEAFTLTVGVRREVVHVPIIGNSASYVADEVMRCLQAGQLESDVMPLNETLAIALTVDHMREQWRLSAVARNEPG